MQFLSSTIQSTFWGGQWVMINLENNNLAFHHNSNVYSVYIQSMWHMKGNNNIFKSWRNNLINLKNHYCKLYSNFAQSVTEEGQVSRQLDWRIVTNEGPCYWSPKITKIWAKTDIKRSFFARRAKKVIGQTGALICDNSPI